MRNRVLFFAGLSVLAALALLGCSLGGGQQARITPTPTKTPRPLFTATLTRTLTPLPTHTPVPPTDTPVPPTDTRLPPTDTPPPPTSTPVSPTETPALPADTTVPQTATPAPPTATSRPQATRTPAPPTNTPQPAVDYRVVQQDLVPKAENTGGLYTVFVRVEDAAANAIDGLVVWDPNVPEIQAVTGDKPHFYHGEYLMGGGEYYLEVQGSASERTKRVTTIRSGISNEDLIKAGYCVDNNDCDLNVKAQHFSWRVVFQRTW